MKAYGIKNVCAVLLICLGFWLPANAYTNQPFGTQVGEIARTVQSMVADPNRPYVYATTTVNTVIAIDTTTQTIAAEFSIGSNPLGLAISPDGTTLYVANSGSTTAGIGVIDLTTLTQLSGIATPLAPWSIAAGQNGVVYILGSPSAGDESGLGITIATIDTTTGDVLGTVANTGNQIDFYAGIIAITPDLSTLFYGDTGLSPAELYSFDLSTGLPVLQTTGTFDIYGSNGQALVISPDGKSLVFCTGSGQGGYGTALIPTNNIDGSEGIFDVGAYPSNGAFSPDGTLFYAAPEANQTLKAYSTTTFQEVHSASIAYTASLVCDRTGRLIFAAGDSTFDDGNPANLLIIATGAGVYPVVTSVSSATADAGQPFTFTLTSSESEVTWGAGTLPTGLSLEASTGVISGSVATPGSYPINVTVTDLDGAEARGSLTITVLPELTVNVVGDGTITSGYLGSTWLAAGSSFKITAAPAAGYLFTGWSGSVTTPQAIVTGLVEQNVILTATFEPTATLTAAVSGPGTIQPASLLGSTTVLVGTQETINAIPSSGARFTGWTGAITSLRSPLAFTVNSDTSVTANFESLAPYKGTYVLASPPDQTNGLTTITLTVDSYGNFSASLSTPAGKIPFFGNFGSAAGFSAYIGTKPLYNVALQMAMAGGVPVITGTVSANSQTDSVNGYRTGTFSTASPPAALGKYTLLLPPATTAGAPPGWGYGSGHVTATGSTVLTGVLGDQTPFSAAGKLSDAGYFLISAPLYAKKGFLQGWIQFVDQPNQSDCNGTLVWSRPSAKGAAPYAQGFDLTMMMRGSLLPAPSPTGNLLGITSAAITFAGGGLASGTTTNVTISLKDAVTPIAPDPNHLKFTITPATGAISGSFIPPGAKTGVAFHGSIFAKTGTAAGLFMEKTGSGSVVLAP